MLLSSEDAHVNIKTSYLAFKAAALASSVGWLVKIASNWLIDILSILPALSPELNTWLKALFPWLAPIPAILINEEETPPTVPVAFSVKLLPTQPGPVLLIEVMTGVTHCAYTPFPINIPKRMKTEILIKLNNFFIFLNLLSV